MNKQVKKPYQKPTVTQIPLKPEEAVLTACKAAPGSGSHCGGFGKPNFDFGS
jgi:hypothetical protein